MSAIYMCDSCGDIFSVNEANWTQYTRESRRNNAYNHGAETLHMGPCCNRADGEVVKPRVRAIES